MKPGKEKKTRELVITALFLSITLAIQMLRFPPPVTGPLINFMLLFTTLLLGLKKGMIIGLFTPLGALLLGIIPPVLAAAVPFIMLGNSAYCLFFAVLTKQLPALVALAVASGSKFLIIAGAARLLLNLPPAPAAALGIPQLITALTGGLGALLVKDYVLPRVQLGKGGG